MLQLIGKVLSPKFFDILRTQQQLGYVVHLGVSPSTNFIYLIALAQTEFPPDYARSRINSFLDEHFVFIEESLTEDEFQMCRQGILSELKMKPKNLSDEAGRYMRYFSDRTYDFGRRQRAIDFLETTATLNKLRAFARDELKGAPKLYVQVKKVS